MFDNAPEMINSPGDSTCRDRIALAIMALMSLASIGAFVQAWLVIVTVPVDNLAAEAWRMFGYLVFAGLYAIAGVYPRRQPGIWEVLLFHKAATAVYLVPFVGTTSSATVTTSQPFENIVLVDATLVGLTAVAYMLARGWRAWQ